MTSKLDSAIEAAFNFYDHLNDPPDYDDLPYSSRLKIMEGFVFDMPRADLGEITLLVDQYITKKDIAHLMTHSHANDTHWRGLVDILSCYRCAVKDYARDAIDGRIADLFRDYCDSNGIFSDDYPDAPDELIGFRNEDDGEEDRQREVDDISLLKNQAE